MHVTVKWQDKNYRPEDVTARYVRIDSDGVYHFCEVGKNRRYDIRQGTVRYTDVPEAVRTAAVERRGMIQSYVEWPM